MKPGRRLLDAYRETIEGGEGEGVGRGGGGGGRGGGGGEGVGISMLDRGDIEVYGPNSKKEVLHRRFFLTQLLYSSEGIFYNYFESTQKKPVCDIEYC